MAGKGLAAQIAADMLAQEQRIKELEERARAYLDARDAYRDRDSSKNLDAMSFAEDQLRDLLSS